MGFSGGFSGKTCQEGRTNRVKKSLDWEVFGIELSGPTWLILLNYRSLVFGCSGIHVSINAHRVL